jgi:hypothetical protein
MLSSEERQLLMDKFDVYDLVEALDLSSAEIIDAFDFKIVDNPELMESIGVTEGDV